MLYNNCIKLLKQIIKKNQLASYSKLAKAFGGSSHVILPRSMMGKEVMVIILS